MNLIYLRETMTVYSIYYKSILFLLFLLTYVHFPLILKIFLGGRGGGVLSFFDAPKVVATSQVFILALKIVLKICGY